MTSGLTLGRNRYRRTRSKDIIEVAFENGNMFDTAEAYAKGTSKEETRCVIKELDLHRTDSRMITMKLFWGLSGGPNNGSLSRKHIIEGTKGSLERLGPDYVDIIFAHRPDVSGKGFAVTPKRTMTMVEIVRAYNWVIEKAGSKRLIILSPNLVYTHRLLDNVSTACSTAGVQGGSTGMVPSEQEVQTRHHVFSALASGLPTGKCARFATHSKCFKGTIESLQREEGLTNTRKVKSSQHSLERNPDIGAVIPGASRPERVLDNLKILKWVNYPDQAHLWPSTSWVSCEPTSGTNENNAIGTGGEWTRYRSTLPRTL
ncbi:NADP-dependent oxidoreductase domain-containing protein [Boletus coccyginus]|nr:NADP-dependent oxidoreductase domain-containing protein [Boletus coccyginus]